MPAYAEIVGWHYADPAKPHAAALPEAYLRAGIDPADIQFVEGHGAATADDDLAELTALLEVLGTRKAGARHHCALGSVAANIGDTRAAAGIAALLKTAFAMTADIIPPSTGCVRPNRLLRGGGAPFRFPSAPELVAADPGPARGGQHPGHRPLPGRPEVGPGPRGAAPRARPGPAPRPAPQARPARLVRRRPATVTAAARG